jgi:hypothetical protein
MSSNFPSVLQNSNQSIIDALRDCVEACNTCGADCLEERDVKILARCIGLNIDCAEICDLTLRYLSRNSEFSASLADECVVICEACARECEKHIHMVHCVECARVCRKCSQECRKIASPHD